MGRIGDLIPALYHGDENELLGFNKALEPEIDFLEQKIRELPSLADVDRCPDRFLPYLAAVTNCPLVGKDPKYWRQQIRNWPWLLKIKGTEESLIVFLNAVGAEKYTIRTWFRDAGGAYVEKKPEGEPYYNQVDGLWYNIRTHYFSVEVVLGWDFVVGQDYYWTVDEIKEKLGPWFERAKPFHAELLNMLILPPPPDRPGHRCRWDWCTWDHGTRHAYDWEMGEVEEELLPETELLLGRSLCLGTEGLYARGRCWDASKWDDGLMHGIRDFGGTVVISAVLSDRDECMEEHKPIHKWHAHRTWRCGGTWRASCDEGSAVQHPGVWTFED